MLKSQFFMIAATICMLAGACGPTVTPAPILTEEPVTSVAVVKSEEIQFLESSPVQVRAVVSGELPDAGCTTIGSINQIQEGNTIKVTLMTITDPLTLCAQSLTSFEEIVPLEVRDLPGRTYNLNVNGVEQSFQLIADLAGFKQSLVEALHSRDYDGLKTMMGESLFIAPYRSEGSAYDSETAIEQLKLNYIKPAAPIVADFNKDLATLAGGIDPLSIFGLDVGPNHAVFVSGWGLEGKDEAVLFVNYRLDGSLYWHGVLIASGGFASSNNPSTSVNETSVQYVMAQQDISIYGGPSTESTILGSVAAGQVAMVTGISTDGSWWRVICPDSTTGSCWLSANPGFTQPTIPPG